MNLRVEDYISIKLHQTDLKLTSEIKSRLQPYNLAPEQNLVMMLLWEKDGLTQNQLSEKLGKDKTNIARMVVNLEGKGFIERKFCPNDRRSLEVYLTECGRKLKEEVVPVSEAFNADVTEGLSKQDLEHLDQVLTKILNNIKG
ncbi:MarR family winged helix-turn-helix transcriptional regulator [Halobacillus litoralis]|uniref:MarR family winged helix-turn-helix transcriptional regulator n=1 Tax=Halobacillus litoralis TaxID=45668 RepID=UPI001CD59F95|nr:MarR family transcriptional regulator [Halobacillus litoralis]MCA1022206.1 MarR family transcriptional regulator [Halobacillus litoralis]